VAEDNLERAKEKAPQPEPLTPDAGFTSEREQGQILSRLDALENHSATKADLHSTHLAISAATIAALLVFLSVSVGANIALFRMLVGTILDAFTSAIHQPLRPPSSSLPRDAIGPRDDLVSPEP
jgi:hypothetical protein